ncbi:MAG: TniQ family protein [Desulfobulbaceae bacterium]|nr:TniQ family protein [Desulfobulbaceae bacterium]
MDSAYSWHPGTVRVTARWAVSVELLPDELFSSWLVRLSLANGSDPLAFTGAIWPGWRPWTSDVDRQPHPDRLAILAGWSSINAEFLTRATLAPIAGNILGHDPFEKNLWPWILSTGARNRSRQGGLQYCPFCLSEDATPYYRLHWRLAWHVVCARHGCLLLDRCPVCEAPLEPHKIMAEMRSVDLCATCRCRLTDVNSSERNDVGFLRYLQEITDHALIAGKGMVLGETVSVQTWFDVLRFWRDLVRQSFHGRTESMAKLAELMPSMVCESADCGVFETMRTAQRASLLKGIAWLMRLGSDELVTVLRQAGVSRQNLFQARVPPVDALQCLTRSLPDRKAPSRKARCGNHKRTGLPSPRSRRVVEWMMKKLQKKLEAER